MMRQAGRYLPKCKATHVRADSFLDLCKSTELATEVTIQPLGHFNLDAAILFPDILTVPDAMGLGLYFAEGEGPKSERALQHEADIAKLQVPNIEKLQYVFNTVTPVRKVLDDRVPLISFSGSPFTLTCYMVEGGSSREFRAIKAMMYSRPDLLHKILDTNAQVVTAYLNAQIDTSAQAIQVFDTWDGVLSNAALREFSLRHIRQIITGLKRESEGRRVPVIILAKGGGLWLESTARIGTDALGLDWACDIGEAHRRVSEQVALQGNFDPFAPFDTPKSIRTEVTRILADYDSGNGHVFNLSHGVNQHADPEYAKTLIDTVHELSRQYHS